ncbi:biotin carboxyl carrier protein [Ekhidna lutea]|uniref:Biotin carboxyl carrier protein n=1 Tax=Ekhidna lutea TaxID=447679 RepID=A0A239JBX1_EKHLU|nr:biotin/lipoyl-containing protein [Ekhidna lutea]SNT02793.1 biotin carboxyl carrier protein [Ekhidna lutea]
MIEIKAGDTDKIKVQNKKDGVYLNDKLFDGEVIKIDDSSFKVFKSNKIFRVDVVERVGKEMKLKVNDHLIEVSITDHIDQILDKLGMNIAASAAVKDVKAPMPGSILNIIVAQGDEVKEGDQLLVLEAMKMENVIKSPGEGKVAKVHIAEKENVEKNQVLISFE